MTAAPGPDRSAIPVAALVLIVSLVLAVSPAHAAPSGEPTPSPSSARPDPSPAPTPEPVRPTSVEVIPADFSPTGSGAIRGTAQPGGRVVVTADGAEVCAVATAGDGTFDCGIVRLPDGDDVRVVATETVPGVAAPQPGTMTVDVLGPPRVDGPRRLLTTGLVSGTARPGAAVAVSVDGAVDPACTAVPVPSSTYWSCNLSRPSGQFTLRAQQSDTSIADGRASGFSNPQDVVIDRDAPDAAVITSPAANARISASSITVSGTAEARAAIDVYLDSRPACATSAVDGPWSCEVALVGVARGEHVLQAVIRDEAGNYASPTAVRVLVVGRSGPIPSTSPAPAPEPVVPADPGGPAPPSGEGQPAPDDGADPAPPGDSPGPIRFDWAVPTGFGTSILSLVDSVSTGGWYLSPLLALVFLALIAIPIRMLASALRGRIAGPRLTGRNRPVRWRSPATGGQPVPSNGAWARTTVAVAVTAGLAVVSVGIAGEVRYLRLYLAVALGLVVLNLLGGVVATRLAGRLSGAPGTVRFLPLMLGAAALTALVSRSTGLEPPVITGVLVGAAFAAEATLRRRAAVSIAQVGTVTLLGFAGWVLVETDGTGAGFWALVADEMLATICLAGLGSALVLVLPIAALPGRVILEWSPAAWVVTTLVVSTVASGVVFGGVLVGVSLTPWLFAAAAFAALSIAIWGYIRFVEPQVRT